MPSEKTNICQQPSETVCEYSEQINKPLNIIAMKVETIMQQLAAKHPGEAEYLQAVQEVLESIEEVYNQHPEFEQAKIVERMLIVFILIGIVV